MPLKRLMKEYKGAPNGHTSERAPPGADAALCVVWCVVCGVWCGSAAGGQPAWDLGRCVLGYTGHAVLWGPASPCRCVGPIHEENFFEWEAYITYGFNATLAAHAKMWWHGGHV
jgi:hypothetical protein